MFTKNKNVYTISLHYFSLYIALGVLAPDEMENTVNTLTVKK